MSEQFERVSELKQFDEPVTALVIGGSRGLGAAFVEALLDCDNVAAVHVAARSLEIAHDGKRHDYPLDVTDDNSIDSFVHCLGEQAERLDLVIYAAGILHDEDHDMRPERQLKEMRRDNLERSFAINTFGPMLLAARLQPLLASKSRCVWANISARVGSIGDNGFGGWYAYRASKAAQNMFSKGLAIELSRRNKQACVLALHPGTTDTELSEPFQANVPEHKLFSAERSAHQLLDVINKRGAEENGTFWDWAGEPIEW